MNKEDTMNFGNDQTENASTEASDEIDNKQIILNKRDNLQPITVFEKLKMFFLIYWRGILCLITPLIMILILLPLPPKKYQICGYTLIVMAIYWVTECIPLPVTSFLPVVIFPLTGVMSTRDTCKCYMNDTIMMFLGSMILAYSVEQSGLHHRLALCAIRAIGYSHYRLLFALCFVTMFISMWITNTAAVTMMVPIIFALLKVFEDQGQIKVFERNKDGDAIASDLTVCYFCAATYSATIGGVGTLVGTVTNLVFKGLFSSRYSEAPDYLSFPMFSAFAVPYMIAMEIFLYFSMCVVYLGLLRPKSVAAKRAKMTPAALNAVKSKVDEDWKKLGKITFWEIMVITLFTTAMCLFFGRSPQLFVGWGDRISDSFRLKDYKFILDSATAMLIATSMFLLPSNLTFLKNFSATRYDELPNTTISSVLDWTKLNPSMPYSFMFLLGGGFALSEAAKPQYSDLNGEIGKVLTGLKELPNQLILLILIAFAIFVTNFASNVAVCNVITPIGMQLAQEIGQNPLWYCIATGFSASYCFCLPVGTPGNLIAQGAAKIPTPKMIIAGLCPTIFCLIITWFAFNFYAPIIWPDLRVGVPKWIK